jgi:hypothetical protein
LNPTGHNIPPASISPCKNWKNELTDDASLGTLGIARETSWITGEVFFALAEAFFIVCKTNLGRQSPSHC